MTEKINKIIFADTQERRRWKIPEVGKNYSLKGNLQNEEKFFEEVTLISENAVSTDGKIYMLSELQEDYEAFVEATKKNIPVIEYWNIKGNKRNGYYISGFVGNNLIEKKIIDKDSNIVVLDDGKQYFVQWRNYSPEFNLQMFDLSCAADDIKFPDSFEWFGDAKCKPIIIIS